MTDKLTRKEKKEPMLMTWGRIRSGILFSSDERLKALVKKFDADIDKVKFKKVIFPK